MRYFPLENIGPRSWGTYIAVEEDHNIYLIFGLWSVVSVKLQKRKKSLSESWVWGPRSPSNYRKEKKYSDIWDWGPRSPSNYRREKTHSVIWVWVWGPRSPSNYRRKKNILTFEFGVCGLHQITEEKKLSQSFEFGVWGPRSESNSMWGKQFSKNFPQYRNSGDNLVTAIPWLLAWSYSLLALQWFVVGCFLTKWCSLDCSVWNYSIRLRVESRRSRWLASKVAWKVTWTALNNLMTSFPGG